MGINLCPYTNMGNKWAITHVHAQKGDDKWESTHVHQNHFHQEYAAVKQQAKDGTRLIKPIGVGLTQSQKGAATT